MKTLKWPQYYTWIFQTPRGRYLPSQRWNLTKIRTHPSFITCKNEEYPIKNEVARVATTFLSLYVYGDFSRRFRSSNSAVGGRIWQNFELIRDFMAVLISFKNGKDSIKNEGYRVPQHYTLTFQTLKGR